MSEIMVVDARMGRGKSSAAIRYMNKTKGSKRFLYITPFLSEVARVCEWCDFDQPDSDLFTKSVELKMFLREGKNVAATHSLFYLMDNEALGLVKDKHYSLIIDENISVIERKPASEKDLEDIITNRCSQDEAGLLHWKDREYEGRFSDYKQMCEHRSLMQVNGALISILSPDFLTAFDEVIMMTYMFDGQYQKAYLDYFGFPYHIVGVEYDGLGYTFSDKPDEPPSVDFRELVHIVGSKNMNKVGNSTNALSRAWYSKRGYEHDDMRNLRNKMKFFFEYYGNNGCGTRLWTCFKDSQRKLIDARTGRYKNSFLQLNARATNQYRNVTDMAYMVNRFPDPNIANFFRQRGIQVDRDKFALSEMLQWIWRSAIRDGNPINLYVPSRRMRTLLTDWIELVSEGGIA
jgi:hypothetical protein